MMPSNWHYQNNVAVLKIETHLTAWDGYKGRMKKREHSGNGHVSVHLFSTVDGNIGTTKRKRNMAEFKAQMLDVAECGWYDNPLLESDPPSLNIRNESDYGKPEDGKKVKDSMVAVGWAYQHAVTMIPAVDKEIDGINLHLYAELIQRRRDNQWKSLKEQVKESPSRAIDLNVFETMYIRKGKVAQVKYIGNSGHRRGRLLHDINIMRATQQPEGNPPIVEIPSHIKAFATDFERILDQLRENELKTKGFMPLSDFSRLNTAWRMFQRPGLREITFRNEFKAGIGQKLWKACSLQNKFPQMDVINRLQRPAQDPMYIPWGPLSPQIVGKWLESDLSASEIEEAIHEIKGGKKVEKGMQKKDQEKISQSSPSNVIRATFNAVLKNDELLLRPYEKLAGVHNLTQELFVKGVAIEKMVAALQALA